jgi:hypothetical protein
MITLDAVREAVAAPDPFTQMDTLVRGEMAAGRQVLEVFDQLRPLVDAVLLDTPGLTEDGEEAFLGTLDALTGNCHPDCCYYDSPGPSHTNGTGRPVAVRPPESDSPSPG